MCEVNLRDKLSFTGVILIYTWNSRRLLASGYTNEGLAMPKNACDLFARPQCVNEASNV